MEPTVRSALESHGAAHAEIRVTQGPEDAISWAGAAAGEGFDLLLAGGGDGTVNAVSRGVLRAGSGLPIGILPLGTGNGLARVLGIPMAPEEAIRKLARGRVVELDAVDITSHGAVSLLFFGAGLDARINQQASESGDKSKMGFLAYIKAALGNLRRLPDHDLSVALDERPAESLTGHTVTVFNATRLKLLGLPVGPDSQPHDGRVGVVVLRSTGFWRNAGQVLRLINRATSQLELEPAARLRLDATPPLPVHVDGDAVGETPLEAVVLPGALRFIATADYRDDHAQGSGRG